MQPLLQHSFGAGRSGGTGGGSSWDAAAGLGFFVLIATC